MGSQQKQIHINKSLGRLFFLIYLENSASRTSTLQTSKVTLVKCQTIPADSFAFQVSEGFEGSKVDILGVLLWIGKSRNTKTRCWKWWPTMGVCGCHFGTIFFSNALSSFFCSIMKLQTLRRTSQNPHSVLNHNDGGYLKWRKNCVSSACPKARGIEELPVLITNPTLNEFAGSHHLGDASTFLHSEARMLNLTPKDLQGSLLATDWKERL